MTGTRERVLRTAEVIAVGSELLGTARLDTNSLFIAERLAGIGIELRSKSVVGDNRDLIAGLCRQALWRVDLVVITGGLGPTDDNLTRDAVAAALGLAMIEHQDIVEHLAARFAKRGLKMPDINRRQAQVLEGAVVLANPNGTAPGQYLEHGSKVIVLLPGPPRELQPMLNLLCEGAIGARAAGDRIYRTSLFVTGRGESHVEEIAQPIYSVWRSAPEPIETTILATPGQIELHLSLRSADAAAAERRLRDASSALAAALGADVFSLDGRPMEELVGAMLRERRLTIAAAESCTGGLMMSRLTDVPGSSDYVVGGLVLYSNELKTKVGLVPASLIEAHGAVSEPVAVAMAEGVRERTGADVSVGITGIAGPGGGTPQKPVGTACIAVMVPSAPARVRTATLFGNRAQFKFNASQAALDMVRRRSAADVRLFVGLALDEPVRSAAAAVSGHLERRITSVARDFKARWIPPANLHITVWFFGEVADEPAAELARHLGAHLQLTPFDLAVRGCGAFPRSGAPRVLWIGTGEGSAGMIAAHAAVVERLAPLGHTPEARPFSPHLTLARVKEPGRAARAVRQVLAEEPADCGHVRVTALTLFRSRLSPHGAVYEPLQRVH